jgi:hypothetical protein
VLGGFGCTATGRGNGVRPGLLWVVREGID